MRGSGHELRLEQDRVAEVYKRGGVVHGLNYELRRVLIWFVAQLRVRMFTILWSVRSLVILGEICRILQLPYLFIIQCPISSNRTFVCCGKHEHLLLVLRCERVPLISGLWYDLPLTPWFCYHWYHILVGRGSVVVFELSAEFFDFSNLVMCLVSSQIDRFVIWSNWLLFSGQVSLRYARRPYRHLNIWDGFIFARRASLRLLLFKLLSFPLFHLLYSVFLDELSDTLHARGWLNKGSIQL